MIKERVTYELSAPPTAPIAQLHLSQNDSTLGNTVNTEIRWTNPCGM